MNSYVEFGPILVMAPTGKHLRFAMASQYFEGAMLFRRGTSLLLKPWTINSLANFSFQLVKYQLTVLCSNGCQFSD